MSVCESRVEERREGYVELLVYSPNHQHHEKSEEKESNRREGKRRKGEERGRTFTIIMKVLQKAHELDLIPPQDGFDLWWFIRIRYEDLFSLPPSAPPPDHTDVRERRRRKEEEERESEGEGDEP